MTIVSVDIFANVACPRCLVAWRRLQRALAEVGEAIEVEVHWLPMGSGKSSKKGAMALAAVAREEGVVFEGAPPPGVDTTDAQRLILLAQEKGKATPLQERLFDDYFNHKRDLADQDVLCDAAEAVGIGRYEAEGFLRSSAGRKAVGAFEAEAKALGVTEAPAIVLNEELTLNGLEPFETIVASLHEAARRAALDDEAA